MKTKVFKTVLIAIIAMLALSACTFSFAIDGKEVISGNADKEAIASAICLSCDSKVVAPVVTPVVEEPEKVTTPEVNKECGYDYMYMPLGRDSLGIPLADYGINYRGDIEGPALVQIDSLAVIYVLPGQIYDVVKGITWKYNGDEACMRAQFESFPGKQFLPVPTP